MTYPNSIQSFTIREAHAELLPLFDRRDSRKIQNNTYARLVDDGSIVIRYHATDILTYHGDDTMTIDTGGWHTTTTAARYSNWLPRLWSVSNDRGAWNVWTPNGERTTSTYDPTYSYSTVAPAFRIWDGMIITDEPRQRVVNYRGAPDFTADDELRDVLAGMIADYVALYDRDRIVELFGNGDDPVSTAGDCFYCLIEFADDQSTDHMTRNVSHIVSHLIESYSMVSIVRNAFRLKRRLIPANIPAISLDDLEFARIECGMESTAGTV